MKGQTYGNRLIIADECKEEDWIKINKPIPKEPERYVLGKCLNCGSIIPTDIRNLKKQPPKRCVFCSNIGNHHKIGTNTNSWNVFDNTAICTLYYQNKPLEFVIDYDLYDTAKQYIWRASKKKNKFYIVSGSIKKNTLLYIHQLAIGCAYDNSENNLEIDHIDGNSLNNRKSNLRFVTHQENIDNIKATRIDNSIGIRGISFNKRSKKYVVDFNYHGKRTYFKPWDSIEEAVYCRKCAEEIFDLHLVDNNPLYNNYLLYDENKKKEIKEYVSNKISRK